MEGPDRGQSLLLRARRERPRSCCAAQCDEFSPSDVNCHATPPARSCVHAIEGQYHPLAKERIPTREDIRRILRSSAYRSTQVIIPGGGFGAAAKAGVFARSEASCFNPYWNDRRHGECAFLDRPIPGRTKLRTRPRITCSTRCSARARGPGIPRRTPSAKSSTSPVRPRTVQPVLDILTETAQPIDPNLGEPAERSISEETVDHWSDESDEPCTTWRSRPHESLRPPARG